ncbi:MAG: 4Fe-4S dicluster domain-containing protein [Dehalobacterium sp.]
MTQYGFYIDQSRCIGCNSCTVSCMQWNNIEPGNIRWMRVQTWEENNFPHTRLHILPVNCYQCEDPLCIKVCKNGAIYKEEKFGAVLVDREKCQGDRNCWKACPYGAPQFASNEKGEKMSKCNMCIDRLEKGQIPVCVRSCSMRALDFGPLKELQKKYGALRQLSGMPNPSIAKPSVVFKAAAEKFQVVKYDAEKALQLWQKRSPAAEDDLIFDHEEMVTKAPREIVGRNKLVLKAKTCREKQYYATDDD